jgi:hypothetical protein
MGVISKQAQKPVWGILTADDFHPRIVFIACTGTNMLLRRCRFTFTFEAIEQGLNVQGRLTSVVADGRGAVLLAIMTRCGTSASRPRIALRLA